MALSLIDNMSTDFSPDKFSDEYQDQLRQLIAAKLEKGDAVDTAATFGEQEEDQADRGEVIDLMEALRRSVEQAKHDRGTLAPARRPARKRPAKQATKSVAAPQPTPVRKAAAPQPAPVRKAAAATKRSPARKTAAKKSTEGR